MSISEFRYNKKRKHYSYIFKDVGSKRKNIILSSKPVRKEHKKVRRNIKLYKHPNPKANKDVYLIPKVYIDENVSFDKKREGWKFHPNDKRIVKRIKKK